MVVAVLLSTLLQVATEKIAIDPFIGMLVDNRLANAESSGTVVRYVIRS